MKVCEITAAVPPPEDIHGVLTHNCAVSPSAFGRRPSRHHKPPGCRWNVEKEEVVAVATAVPASKDDDGAPFLPQDRAVRVPRGRCRPHGFERRPRVVPVWTQILKSQRPSVKTKKVQECDFCECTYAPTCRSCASSPRCRQMRRYAASRALPPSSTRAPRGSRRRW